MTRKLPVGVRYPSRPLEMRDEAAIFLPRYKYACCSFNFTTTRAGPECRSGMCVTTRSLTVLQAFRHDRIAPMRAEDANRFTKLLSSAPPMLRACQKRKWFLLDLYGFVAFCLPPAQFLCDVFPSSF